MVIKINTTTKIDEIIKGLKIERKLATHQNEINDLIKRFKEARKQSLYTGAVYTVCENAKVYKVYEVCLLEEAQMKYMRSIKRIT